MSRIKRGRPSPAIVIAVLALVAALAGTAVAGSGPDVTTAKQHKLTKKMKKQVRNISTNKAEKALDEVLPIGASELGPITTVSASTAIPTATNGTATATCTNGKLLSGGWDGPPFDGVIGLLSYVNKQSNNGWTASARSNGPGTKTLTVYARCLDDSNGDSNG